MVDAKIIKDFKKEKKMLRKVNMYDLSIEEIQELRTRYQLINTKLQKWKEEGYTSNISDYDSNEDVDEEQGMCIKTSRNR